MTDLLGPASAPNAVTTRPAETRTFGATDTWFKPCTTPATPDGTMIQAVFLNAILAQIRTVIRSAGITVDDSNDAMLWQAIQAAAGSTSGLVERAGDTMLGFLSLYGDPTSAAHAATKHYVDQIVSGFLALTGGTLTGNVTQNVAGSASWTLNKTAGNYATVLGETGGVPDWGLEISNNVRQFALARYSAGAYVENVLAFDPATGVGNFTHQPTFVGSPLLTSVATAGALTGDGTPGNPVALAAHIPSTIFAAYAGGAASSTSTGAVTSGASVASLNITSVTQGSFTLFHVVFAAGAPANYVVVFGTYGNASGSGGAVGSVAQAHVVGAGNEWGVPAPTANDFYIYAGDPAGSTPCPPFICVLT